MKIGEGLFGILREKKRILETKERRGGEEKRGDLKKSGEELEMKKNHSLQTLIILEESCIERKERITERRTFKSILVDFWE